MTLERYQCEDRAGAEFGPVFVDIQDAREYAQRHRLRIVAHVFVFDDSEMIEDYTTRHSDKKEDR